MAKTIHWTVPFQSLKGCRYTVNIYDDDYAGTPEVLTAAEQPFTTDEEGGEDFFAPVRGQNGTLRVIDYDGTLLPAIIPANNTARPVILVRHTDNTDTVEWQGFIGCENYSQTYQSTAQEIDLNLLSALQAMDSVQASTEVFSGLMSIRSIIAACMESINQYGVSYGTIYVSKVDQRILDKLVNTSIFFEQKEQTNESSVTYVVSGVSLKSILDIVCRFMGWCAREKQSAIYFQRIGSNADYSCFTLANLKDDSKSITNAVSFSVQQAENEMSAFEYRGIDHTIATAAGARSVEVIATTAGDDVDLSLPECPDGELETITKRGTLLKGLVVHSSSTTLEEKWVYLYASHQLNAYSNIDFKMYTALCRPESAYAESVVSSTLTNLLQNLSIATRTPPIMEYFKDVTALYRFYAGAFFCKEGIDKVQNNAQYDPSSGIHCVFFPGMLESSNTLFAGESRFPEESIDYIFRMQTELQITVPKGYFQLTMSAATYYLSHSRDDAPVDDTKTRDVYVRSDWNPDASFDKTVCILLLLRVGEQWWNGKAWVGEKAHFETRLQDGSFQNTWDSSMKLAETDGIIIPTPGTFIGDVELQILNIAGRGVYGRVPLEMFIKNISVGFIGEQNALVSTRSNNHYFRLLGTNFSDEVSINTELATNMSNQEGPHIIRNSKEEAASSSDYYIPSTGAIEARRPEKDLLNRLATFYQQSRCTISIKAERPTVSLPVTTIVGYDGKTYSPIAESRDWRTDCSTITCVEIPEIE